MKLNYENAVSAGLLDASQKNKQMATPPILHFGVGGFHRAHQGWALQNLQHQFPGTYDVWGISGVCIMPGDLPFVEAFRSQDCLYYVQSFAADGEQSDSLVSVIKELLHPANDYAVILARIASKETKVISFTITEGGYNVDYNKPSFLWETPAIQNDLKRAGHPETVFRILAEGLRKRMEMNGSADESGIILLSCDNVQHNGDILKFALLEFLEKFDQALISWVEENVSFVKTMVDRITPATSIRQKEAFAATHLLEDNCLVVSEDFFQWVIEKDKRLEGLPYPQMGATIVEDVAPYEKMKLRLLNGGHSLTGLLGDLLGYDRIHTAISDPLVSTVYRRYCTEEVIDTLDDLKEVDYEQYVTKLISRFSNPMINDSTERIISGSTDKLPKFVCAVMVDQLAGPKHQIKWATLILAAWYCYLDNAFKKDQMAGVIDLNRADLLRLFSRKDFGPAEFLDNVPALAALREDAAVRKLFVQYVQALLPSDQDQKRLFIQQLLETEK